MADKILIEEKEIYGKKYLTLNIPEQFVYYLYDSFSEICENHITKNCSIIVDFSNTVLIDSIALGLLVLLRHYADNNNAIVKLSGASERVLQSLKVAKFDTLFDLETAAVEG